MGQHHSSLRKRICIISIFIMIDLTDKIRLKTLKNINKIKEKLQPCKWFELNNIYNKKIILSDIKNIATHINNDQEIDTLFVIVSSHGKFNNYCKNNIFLINDSEMISISELINTSLFNPKKIQNVILYISTCQNIDDQPMNISENMNFLNIIYITPSYHTYSFSDKKYGSYLINALRNNIKKIINSYNNQLSIITFFLDSIYMIFFYFYNNNYYIDKIINYYKKTDIKIYLESNNHMPKFFINNYNIDMYSKIINNLLILTKQSIYSIDLYNNYNIIL